MRHKNYTRDIFIHYITQRVSRVADEEAELTEATDMTKARQRPRNERRTTMELHGHARSARERERERVRVFGWGRNWARGASEWVRDLEKGSGAWGSGRETRVVGASMVESTERRLGEGRWLTGGVRRPVRATMRTGGQGLQSGPAEQRERMGACANGSAPTGRSHRAAGGREGEIARARLSHPVLEGKPNANHVRARISNSRTQQLHNMDIITQCSNSIKKGNNSRLHHMSETST
jgi:hypothetical protein